VRFSVENGRLQRDGEPFVAIGFNYQPSHAGCHLWLDWDGERIEADLRAIAERGFNTIRFFVMWADFEPQPGHYAPAAIERLRSFVRTASEHDLACLPSLLTLWMNGMVFDLAWRSGRSLWTDETMLRHERAFVTHLAAILREEGGVLAYDLGDEILHAGDEAPMDVDRSVAGAWQVALAAAVREGDPGALVLQANEASALVGMHAFGPDNASALDLAAVHGFPEWASVAIESTRSPEASLMPGFLTALSRAFAAPLLDEFGAYGVSEEIGAGYARAAARSALAAGSNGVLFWSWQDVVSDREPYASRPRERYTGALDADGRPRLVLAELEALAGEAGAWAGQRPEDADVGIYLPDAFREPDSAYLDDEPADGPSLFSAYVLAKRAHVQVAFVRDHLEAHRLVIAPSMRRLTLADHERLRAFVAGGGTLYLSPGSRLHGFGGEELFGVALADFTTERRHRDRIIWRGRELRLPPGEQAGEPLAVIEPRRSAVLATFPGGDAALTAAEYGRGRTYYLNAPLERRLGAPGTLDRAPWHELYRWLADTAGVVRPVDCDVPDVELQLVRGSDGRGCWAINHACAAVRTELRFADSERRPLHLHGKAAALVSLPEKDGT